MKYNNETSLEVEILNLEELAIVRIDHRDIEDNKGTEEYLEFLADIMSY